MRDDGDKLIRDRRVVLSTILPGHYVCSWNKEIAWCRIDEGCFKTTPGTKPECIFKWVGRRKPIWW